MLSKKTEIYRTFSSEETKKLGYDIARALTKNGVRKKEAVAFALQGDLGAGKTTFVQGFLKGLGSKKRATSPTFVLMRRHALSSGRTSRGGRGAQKKFANIFHIDAYRIKDPKHLAVLNLDEIFAGPGNIALVEWPENARRFLPKAATWIRFKYGKKENERTIAITRAAQTRSAHEK